MPIKEENQMFIDMKNDLTEFHGLVRKLTQHGWREGQIRAMVGNCFWYDQVKNDLSEVINIWHRGRVEEIKSLNPHLA